MNQEKERNMKKDMNQEKGQREDMDQEQDKGLIEQLKEKVLGGDQITKEEALKLYEEPLEKVCHAADEIRRFFCKDRFDLCTIVNGKSGKCSEDCK